MADSGIYSSDRLIKEEPIDDIYSDISNETKTISKLIERIKTVERERDCFQSQLLNVIGKYTESEQRNAQLEAASREATASAARVKFGRISRFERAESEKVIEWVNKYKEESANLHESERTNGILAEEVHRLRRELDEAKAELANNHAVSNKSGPSSEEVERLRRELEDVKVELSRNHDSVKNSEEVEWLRRELEDVKKQLVTERNSKEANEINSKKILKSNMDLSREVQKLRQVKLALEEDIRKMILCAQSSEQKLSDEKAKSAESMARAAQCAKELQNVKSGLHEDVRNMTLCAQSFEAKLAEERVKVVESERRAAQCEKNLSEYKEKNEERVSLLKNVIETADRERLEAQAEAAELRKSQAKLKTDHDEMRKINGFLATTASGKIYEELAKARKHIESLEKKVNPKPPFDPRLECAQPKKRKTG